MPSAHSKARAPWVKPYKDFPLTRHPSGQLCKKVRGRVHYFGAAGDWKSAMLRYEFQRPYLERGLAPPPMPDVAGVRPRPVVVLQP